MKKQSARGRAIALSSVAFGALAAAASGSPAFAQDGEEEEAIVVTGSRIARQDYVANSPIVTVDQEDLEITGVQTVDTLLNQLPQFAPGVSASSNNPSNGGQSNLQLRGLGASRTLIMVDGRRLVPSNSTSTVDVNILPAQLIGNIEIVTGGASAVYGSDAIGGVVNFQLRDFEGFEISAQHGETGEGDGINDTLSIALGGEFDGGRGRAMMMASWDERGFISNNDRDFSRISGPSTSTPLGNTVFEAANLPSQLAINAAITQPMGLDCTPPGIDTGCAVPTDTFGFNNTGGTVFDYRSRLDFVSPGGAAYDGGLLPGPLQSADFQYITGLFNYLVLPLVRYNAFARSEYDINDNIQVYADFLWTQYESSQQLASSPTTITTQNRVPRSNPFVTPELGAILDSRPTPAGTFRLDKRFNPMGFRVSEFIYNINQTWGGLRGDFAMAEDWSYDIYATYGRMQNDTIQTGNISRGAVQQLLNDPNGGAGDELFTPGLDADVDPDGLICPGGFNFFGDATLSPQCVAFIGRTSKNYTEYELRGAEATIQGPLPFGLPAGELQVALGATYREDIFNFVPDQSLTLPLTVQPTACVVGSTTNPCLTGNDIAGFNPSAPVAGEISVFEVFGEVLIPIVRDLPLMQEVNIILGGRLSNYSTVGNIETHKADLEWTLLDGLRFRGSYENAVRAPSIGELFQPAILGFPAIGTPNTGTTSNFAGDPCDVRSAWRSTNGSGANQAAATNADVEALCIGMGVPAGVIDTFTYGNNQWPAIQGGNPNLGVESAETWSVGWVLQPRWGGLFENLSMSIDYYDIRVNGIIGTIPITTSRNLCFNGTTLATQGSNPTYDPTNFFCQLFVRDPATGQHADYSASVINTSGVQVRGIDVGLDWSHDLGPGELSLNIIANQQLENSFQPLPGGAWADGVGTIGATIGSATPEYRYSTTVGYEVGPWDFAIRHQWIDEFDTPVAAVKWPVMQYWDALVNWDVNDTVTLRAGVNNITDEQPNVFNGAQQANTDPTLYDVNGRRAFVGVRARF